ncbi:Putative Copper/Zinc superoxide dismutase [Pseudooceanicola batsensis HTCC2597]|uniref:Superoxide dismutase [Cu-Zn] n=1 Tax=Pseudooceanicola batsensis (strain ATCC BAA-863 / DSM 15984 / KCTC 12145 / HTCC2597) TaxID=252305 RepID=A3TWS1_PSEBH|nr:superoxide dismutase family protein [Pseudooceanicola batsensis]EAQ03281.1 Putative Copper/Zinc superoxide dismutase [Pseudooceanicola batsensis HTCC2597]
MTHSRTALPRALGAAALLAIAGAATAQDGQQTEQETTFINADGAEIGTATLTGTPAGLLIELDLRDLPPETWHGFHIHETGECDAEGGFDSAGGHFTISDTEHGFFREGGFHAGDMPNQYVSADGTLKAQVLNRQVFLGGEQGNASGRALMIHGGADDYESQPSGDAGDRIACAVIE